MRLQRSFFEGSTLDIARALLGKTLVHETSEGITSGMIVETEAYLGEIDDASHSYKGKTDRVRVMYDEKGHAYIYLIYGMYYCFNITSGPKGLPEAILIRSLEPLSGIELMKERRKTDKMHNLCSGPGKLCMALGLGKEQYGEDLCGGGALYLEHGDRAVEVAESKRINIDYALNSRDKLWRFTVKGNNFATKPIIM